MPDANYSDEAGEGREVTVIQDQAVYPSSPSTPYLSRATEQLPGTSASDSFLQKTAHRRAIDDIDIIKRRTRGGKYLSIDMELLDDRIREFTRRDIPNDYFRDHPATDYKTLLKEYQDVYQQTFDQELLELSDLVTKVQDHRERALKTTLTRDREELSSSPLLKNVSPREVVVLRFLQIYYQDTLKEADISTLETNRKLIDLYEKFVQHPKEEVTWPDQESF